MTVAAILKHKGYQVATVDPAARVRHIAAILTERKIGAVLVMDATEQLLGIVSERDIVRALFANDTATLDMTAGQLMTRAVQVARTDTTIAEAMHLMTAGRFRHLPVVDRGVVIGIVSIGDVVKARIMQQENEVDSLRAYVSGSG